MIYGAIIAMVSSKTAITDIIGTSPMRLFPVILPQGLETYPAMSFETVDNLSNPTFCGGSTLDHLHADFHAYADSIQEIDNLVNTFRKEMEDTTGVFDGVDIANVRYIDSGSDDYLDDLHKKTRQIELRISYHRNP